MFCVAMVARYVQTRLYYKTNPLPFLSFLSPPIILQWNPSTNGTEECVHISEVHELFLGKEKVSILERCPYFRGLIHAITLLGGRRGVLIAEVSLERGSTVPIKNWTCSRHMPEL